jgi:hypothetical protein
MSKFDGYSVEFPDQPTIVKHSSCCRCQQPTENSPLGTGSLPTGPKQAPEPVKNVIVCLDCLEMMVLDPKKFWYAGWPGQKKK